MTGRESKGREERVRSLARGLAILRYVNAAGEARVAEIAAELQLPRPSVYRLLHTLEEEGYVVCSASDSRVRVTRLAAGLGDSYAAASMICQAAGPVFGAYRAKVKWPLDLTVYENAAMVIQETTHAQSPLSIDRGMIGQRLPMLRSSAGRAYLGSCEESERALILKHLRNLKDPEDEPFLKASYLSSILQEVAGLGLARRESGSFRPDTSSIAVPVKVKQSVVACVSMIWIRSAMPASEAIKGYAEVLEEIAAAIAVNAANLQR